MQHIVDNILVLGATWKHPWPAEPFTSLSEYVASNDDGDAVVASDLFPRLRADWQDSVERLQTEIRVLQDSLRQGYQGFASWNEGQAQRTSLSEEVTSDPDEVGYENRPALALSRLQV